jgi:hypothetical protein
MSGLSTVYRNIKSTFETAMPWVIVLCLAAAMLFDPDRDTLQVSSAAFAVTIVLASASFSYARTLMDGSAVRDEVIFVGERFVSGAAAFLFASILRHASHDVPRYMDSIANILASDERRSVLVSGDYLLGGMFAVVAYGMFLLGLVHAQMGLMLLMTIVSHRSKRRPGHDKFFLPAASLERHVANLDATDKGEPPGQP